MKTMEQYLLGVDGGGTKMLAALATLDGKIVKKTRTGPANYHAIGVENVEKNIREILDATVDGDISRLKACCLGFSGCGRPTDYEVLNPMLDRIGILDRTFLIGDMAVGLMGGALEPKGIIIIAGTGSIVYGIGDDGRPVRAGGYGNWFADEGSGFRIGHKGLRAMMMAKDGRIPPVSFKKPALEFLGLEKTDDLIAWAANKTKEGTIKTDMAAVAPVVIEAAEKGDPAALQILREEVAELVIAVQAVLKNLKWAKLPKVVLHGGVVESNPIYWNMLEKALKDAISGIEVMAPKSSAAVGAVIGAAQKAGLDITPEFIRNLTGSWEAIKE